jgi:hypothetical protein
MPRLTVASAAGKAAQPGKPLRREDRRAAFASALLRPLRWPWPYQSSALVSTSAASVTPITCVVSAPPAGAAAAYVVTAPSSCRVMENATPL